MKLSRRSLSNILTLLIVISAFVVSFVQSVSISSESKNNTSTRSDIVSKICQNDDDVSGKHLKPKARINVDIKEKGEQRVCFGKYIFDGKPGESNWQYEKSNGWDGLCKQGLNQSPVDLPRSGTIKKNMGKLKFRHYSSSPDIIRIKNTGKTLMLDLGFPKVPSHNGSDLKCEENIPMRTGSRPQISEGGLNGSYLFDQLHFHWAHVDSLGSEHSKSSIHFALEAQLVHYNTKYDSIEEALRHEDGIAILVTFFQLSVESNDKLEHFVSHLPNVTTSYSEAILEIPFPLSYLLPQSTHDYLRYNGSLTAPPCTENVKWIIFKKPIGIRLKQLDEFRKLQLPAKRKALGTFELANPLMIVNNYRPIQRSEEKQNVNFYIFENSPTAPKNPLLPRGTNAKFVDTRESDKNAGIRYSFRTTSTVSITNILLLVVNVLCLKIFLFK